VNSRAAVGSEGAAARSQGYSVFSVSKSQAPRVAAYIGKQEAHHTRFTYRQELPRMLKDHDVEFDERYVTDGAD
jgi:hypothetical protein